MKDSTLEIDQRYPLGGIHHVTAISSSAQHIYDFFTNILGLRLAKLTVNQDDYETYHLYFTDEDGNAGTDMTFFDFPGIPKGTKGTNNIDRASFRVPSDASLTYWLARFDQAEVTHGDIDQRFGKKFVEFEDFDGQQYQLISDQTNVGVPAGQPWQLSNVPDEHAIIGLGPVFVKVANYEHMDLVLDKVLGFRKTGDEGAFHQYELAEGGNGATLIIEDAPDEGVAWQGFGNIHHLALRVKDPESLNYWIERIKSFRFPDSGLVDRFYFSSEYFRVAPQVLFELATDTPGIGALDMAKSGAGKVDSYEEALMTSGFWIDETKVEAGLDLSLPPHLFPGDEAVKAATVARLRPLDTSDAHDKRDDNDIWTISRILAHNPQAIHNDK
ncbi:MAG: ring-cleaving dioxygenase [Lactococcus raffinolactis]|uniref:ring-cleaving dioxygenase n=1 Tax=Pseudolactococcus raffinolactis TaxID=1366 RepID=UPI003991C99F